VLRMRGIAERRFPGRHNRGGITCIDTTVRRNNVDANARVASAEGRKSRKGEKKRGRERKRERIGG